MKFGKIWINSFYDKIDISNIKKIYIGDTGLNSDDKNYLRKFNKVEILETNVSDKNSEFKMSESSVSALDVVEVLAPIKSINFLFGALNPSFA